MTCSCTYAPCPSHERSRAIGRRIKYILVDEFQDTDRVQTEILFSIAATQINRNDAGRSIAAGALFSSAIQSNDPSVPRSDIEPTSYLAAVAPKMAVH